MDYRGDGEHKRIPGDWVTTKQRELLYRLGAKPEDLHGKTRTEARDLMYQLMFLRRIEGR